MRPVEYNRRSLQEQGFNEQEIEEIAASLSHRVNLTPEALKHYQDLQKSVTVSAGHILIGNPIFGKIT